ncbi:ABC transporter permease [Pseudokineococcus sp. 5B2Z-1]|uniref:ABC transporter permease n=1 Tax=Pseudokineococcus sp. 5B2Z-1 TaxID=3132744 RepID=UPI0030A4236B
MSQNTPDLAPTGPGPREAPAATGSAPTGGARSGSAPTARASSGASDGPGGLGRLLHGDAARNAGLLVVLALIFLVGWVTAGSSFASVDNMTTILSQAAVLGVVSIGVTFVITGGGIDLSVGSVIGLSSVWASTLATQTIAESFHWSVIVFTGVAVGAVAGLVNGILVAYGRVVSFIATLSMLVAARGLAEIIAQRRTQIVTVDGFLDVAQGDLLGVPVLVWVFLLVAVAGWVLLNRTTFGRRTIAVGGNPEAARLAGIKVRRHTMYLYGIAGVTAGIAGVMFLARTTAGSSTNGQLYELNAIAAVVVGGTLLAGGRGTVVGTVLGVLIFAGLTNVFIQNNLSISAQSIAQGAIIVVAVLLQQRLAARRRPARRSS